MAENDKATLLAKFIRHCAANGVKIPIKTVETFQTYGLEIPNVGQIQYKEVLDRGFIRKDYGLDTVFFNQFGFEWFLCEKKITKLRKGELCASWCPIDRYITVNVVLKGDILSRKDFFLLEDFDDFVELFDKASIKLDR